MVEKLHAQANVEPVPFDDDGEPIVVGPVESVLFARRLSRSCANAKSSAAGLDCDSSRRPRGPSPLAQQLAAAARSSGTSPPSVRTTTTKSHPRALGCCSAMPNNPSGLSLSDPRSDLPKHATRAADHTQSRTRVRMSRVMSCDAVVERSLNESSTGPSGPGCEARHRRVVEAQPPRVEVGQAERPQHRGLDRRHVAHRDDRPVGERVEHLGACTPPSASRPTRGSRHPAARSRLRCATSTRGPPGAPRAAGRRTRRSRPRSAGRRPRPRGRARARHDLGGLDRAHATGSSRTRTGSESRHPRRHRRRPARDPRRSAAGRADRAGRRCGWRRSGRDARTRADSRALPLTPLSFSRPVCQNSRRTSGT